MTEKVDVRVCQRCGRGYVLTATYNDFLARWGRNVIVPVLCPTCFLEKGPLPKVKGRVKWFSARKHYGFLTLGEERDVFFHQEQLLAEADQSLREGQVVRFHLQNSPKGPEALNVETEA